MSTNRLFNLGAALVLSLSFVNAALAIEETVIERGKAVYQLWCWNCHGSGPGKPGTAALKAKHGGNSPAVLEDRTDLTPDLVKVIVRHGVASMPFSRKTEISDTDLDAVALYLSRNSKH